MELIKTDTHIKFMAWRRAAVSLSAVLIVVSVVALFVRGLAFGIDFTGGVLVEAGYADDVELGIVRDTLRTAGFEDILVQHFGSARDVLIRVMPQEGRESADIGARILEVLRAQDDSAELRRVEFVGPQVGEELREQGGLAMMFALIMILIYVTFRFQWKFAVGAVTALLHDVVITIGFFAVFGIGFDLSVLAAVLAVIGYSLNDTIVVFDRIRENFHGIRKGSSEEIMDVSINQTLARTLITGLTTLLVLIALYFLGGEVIHNFSLALIVGIVVGTYSSIYVAGATALALNVTALDLMPEQKEEGVEELDGLP